MSTAEERNEKARAGLRKQIESRYFAGDRQAMLRALADLGDPNVVTYRIGFPEQLVARKAQS